MFYPILRMLLVSILMFSILNCSRDRDEESITDKDSSINSSSNNNNGSSNINGSSTKEKEVISELSVRNPFVNNPLKLTDIQISEELQLQCTHEQNETQKIAYTYYQYKVIGTPEPPKVKCSLMEENIACYCQIIQSKSKKEKDELYKHSTVSRTECLTSYINLIKKYISVKADPSINIEENLAFFKDYTCVQIRGINSEGKEFNNRLIFFEEGKKKYLDATSFDSLIKDANAKKISGEK